MGFTEIQISICIYASLSTYMVLLRYVLYQIPSSAVITLSNLSRYQMNPILQSQEPSRASCGVSILSILEKIDRLIMAPRCMLWFISQEILWYFDIQSNVLCRKTWLGELITNEQQFIWELDEIYDLVS